MNRIEKILFTIVLAVMALIFGCGRSAAPQVTQSDSTKTVTNTIYLPKYIYQPENNLTDTIVNPCENIHDTVRLKPAADIKTSGELSMTYNTSGNDLIFKCKEDSFRQRLDSAYKIINTLTTDNKSKQTTIQVAYIPGIYKASLYIVIGMLLLTILFLFLKSKSII